MKLYRVEIQVCATAYIKADSEEAARAIAAKEFDLACIDSDDGGDIPICGAAFADADMPAVSVSPAMTTHGIWPGAQVEETD
jgi:hypothetical protein